MTLTMLSAACGHPSVPGDAQQVNNAPVIFPDYTDVTMPANICPPNFMMKGTDASPVTEVVARFSVGDKSYTYGEDNKVVVDEDEWAELRDAAKGKAINVEVFANDNEGWKAYKPFAINIAEEEIDPYISYRIIQPSYVSFEDLTIAQRCLENYEQKDIFSNKLLQSEKDGQCINCHSYQNYGTENMLFHVRLTMGGTVIVNGDEIKKVNLKTDSTISAGVYPAWHPTKKLIAFSTNKTHQVFFTKSVNKIEVLDTESDIILYDVEKNVVSNISNAQDEFETYPVWSPDGKTLYYTSAHFEYNENDTASHVTQIQSRYKEIKYNIYKRSFDESTMTFGEQELVFDAAGLEKSATLPRISPDGNYLVFSLGDYGCFHVWHPDADIYLLDLRTQQVTKLDELSSNRSDSYPSFSSNGRWIMTATRRDDGNYTRPYVSYFDKQGKCHKAFAIPQKDPEFNTLFLRSYNRPEFMKEAVKVTAQDLANKIKEDPEGAKFSK